MKTLRNEQELHNAIKRLAECLRDEGIFGIRIPGEYEGEDVIFEFKIKPIKKKR